MKVFNILNLTLLKLKMLKASSTMETWRRNSGPMSSFFEENVWRLREYPLQFRIINLKKSFVKLSARFGVEINDRDIESCHRVCSQGRTIIKFSHRKDCQQLMEVKKELSKLNSTDIDLGNAKIFINQSLYPYYKSLWSKSKRLHAMKQIHSYVSNGTVKYQENSRICQYSCVSCYMGRTY